MHDRMPADAEAFGSDVPRPWVRRLARLMDSCFRVPGTSIRFGLDPIIGLIPGVGDTATLIVGALMLVEARRLGLGLGVRSRMVWNLLLDWAVGLIPGLDLVFDTLVRAHTRNAVLLEREARRRSGRPDAHP